MKLEITTLRLLDGLAADLSGLRPAHIPQDGWLRTVRRALAIPAQEAAKVGDPKTTDAAIRQFERTESDGTIELRNLALTAHRIGCQLVYDLVVQDPATLQRINEITQSGKPPNPDTKQYPTPPEYLKQSGMPLGGYLKANRRALKMSLADVAAKIGVSRQAVRAFERSEAIGAIQLKNLRRIAQAMGCGIVYFLKVRPDVAKGFVHLSEVLWNKPADNKP